MAYEFVLLFTNLEDEISPPGYTRLGGSAFVTKTIGGKVVRSRKTNERSDIPNEAVLVVIYMIMQRIMPSERQSA